MKFTIRKRDLLMALNRFEKEDDNVQIELEPLIETATQAVYENDLRNQAYSRGMEKGYKEGFYEGRCPEKHYRYCNHL